MRVLVNAASAHMGGAVTYLKNLLFWMPQVAPGTHLIVYLPSATKDRLGATPGPGIELRSYPHSRTNGPPRFYFDQVELPRLARKLKADILFSTTGFGTVVSPCPQVLLVRNMAYFDPAFRARYRELGRSLAKNTVRRWHSFVSMWASEAVIFPTRAMQEVVSDMVRMNGRHVGYIHYGHDSNSIAKKSQEFGRAEEIRRWKSEGYGILLNVSTFAVQKNYETIVEALPRLRSSGMQVKVLTTISREQTTDRAEYDALMQRASDLGVSDDLVQLGYVPYEQLGALYELADAYIFPSFTESFGHSLVEAMAAGLPVIAADTAVNKEICAEVGTYFSTFDPESCAEAVLQVLRDPNVARPLSVSRERARAFSWEHHFETLDRTFRSLMDGNGKRD